MTLSPEAWNQTRHRANFACEYCGVEETDTGGELTVDHFQPKSRGGDDDLSNLLYCCHRCNLYKADYSPSDASDSVLWNPRRDPRENHLLILANGALHPISAIGEFTLRRLRLNRPPLVAYRKRKLMQANDRSLLHRNREIANLLVQLQRQQAIASHEPDGSFATTTAVLASLHLRIGNRSRRLLFRRQE